MPVGAFGRVEGIGDGLLDARPGVLGVEPAAVIVERGPGKTCDLQQQRQWVMGLEILDSAHFQRCPDDLKARNFPK